MGRETLIDLADRVVAACCDLQMGRCTDVGRTWRACQDALITMETVLGVRGRADDALSHPLCVAGDKVIATLEDTFDEHDTSKRQRLEAKACRQALALRRLVRQAVA